MSGILSVLMASAAAGISTYNGIVATRGTVPSHGGGGQTSINSRSGHFARSAISQLAILCPNYYGLELAPGADTTITASVEYPAGVLTQILFNSGSASGTIPDGGSLLSDYLTISIPCGERFWIRCFQLNSVGVVCESHLVAYSDDQYMGDASNLINSDQTMTGEVTNSDTVTYHPTVIGPTTTPSVCIFGDSIFAGVTDTPSLSGDMGAIARSIGPYFGYFNAGVNGEAASDFVAHSTQRRSVLQYCTHAVIGYGTNDLFNGDNAATIEGNWSTIYGLCAPKPTFQATIVPRTTSTDAWATTGNQTPAGTESNRVTLNTALRNSSFGPGGGIFDIDSAVEFAPLNSGLWIPDQTNDGIHPNTSGYLDIVTAGAINKTRIGSPASVPTQTGSAWGDAGTRITISTTNRTDDTAIGDGSNTLTTVRGALSHNSGLMYYEIEVLGGVDVNIGGSIIIGLDDGTIPAGVGLDDFLGDTPMVNSYGHEPTAGIGFNFVPGSPFTVVNLGAGYSILAGDVFGYTVDFVNKFIYLARNNTWFLSGNPTSGATGTGHVASWTGSLSLYPAVTFRKRVGPFRLRTNNLLYAPPSGATAWG